VADNVATENIVAEVIVMKNPIFAASAAFTLLIGVSTVGGVGAALAAQDAPSVAEVEDARRCATETRLVGHAFNEVRDSVRAGGTTRAESLLSIAEEALSDAQSACRANPEVSAQLDALSGEAAGLRRSLGSTSR